MRRAVLRALAGMVYGGLPPQRPDQVTPPGGAGVAPGTHAGNLRARSLVLSGTGNGVGLFEYSGAPGPGNPPIAYSAPPGVTKDPFGNPLPVTGGGFTSVNPSFMIAALTAAGLRFHHPAPDFGGATPGLTASGSNAIGATVTLDSGSATGANDSQLILNDSIVGALGRRLVSVETDQLLIQALAGNPSTAARLEVDGEMASVAGGSTFLGSGEAIFPGTQGQVINAIADILLTGASAPVVAGRYRVYGTVTGVNGAIAATQAVGLSTTAGVTGWDVDVDIRSATANTYKAFGRLTGSGQRVGTGALAAGEVFTATYRGLITFSGTGNLNLTGSCVTLATDTWSVSVPGTELAVCQR